MEIRQARQEDAAALARQMKAVADEGRWIATESGTPLEQLVERFRVQLAEGHLVLALQDGERIVGALGVHPTGIEGVHSLGMSILREYRGQGWGRRLIESAVDAASQAGVRKLTLEVWPENGRAVSLYASLGFEVEGYKRDHYLRRDGSLRSALMMARFLMAPTSRTTARGR